MTEDMNKQDNKYRYSSTDMYSEDKSDVMYEWKCDIVMRGDRDKSVMIQLDMMEQYEMNVKYVCDDVKWKQDIVFGR